MKNLSSGKTNKINKKNQGTRNYLVYQEEIKMRVDKWDIMIHKLLQEKKEKQLKEKRFAGKKELDKDADGVPKWADKDDNDPKVGSKDKKPKSKKGKIPAQLKMHIKKKKSKLDEAIEELDKILIEGYEEDESEQLLNRTQVKKKVTISESLQYHLDNDISITDNIFRPYSEKSIELINEVKTLYREGNLELSSKDKWIVKTDIGEYGIFEGRKVPLDIPFIEEYEEIFLEEGEKKEKKKLGSPMRSSGPKKYKVYVRDPKTGNVKTVNFGDAKGGLSVKIRDPKARKSFAARHNCPQAKDRTKPSYWACRIPRFAEKLGLGKVGATWW